MAVFRVEKNQNYTVMSNHHLKNRELSLKSKGLLSQMLSLTYVYTPTKGTAEKLDDYTVQWKIDELGEKHSEGAVLEFNVEHIGTCSGTMEANDDISLRIPSLSDFSMDSKTDTYARQRVLSVSSIKKFLEQVNRSGTKFTVCSKYCCIVHVLSEFPKNCSKNSCNPIAVKLRNNP